MANKSKIILVQLGSPKSPQIKDVRAYLKEFLKDPRVVDINPFLWKMILYFFILPFRPKRSAFIYSRIWDGTSFPLIKTTAAFTLKVRSYLNLDKVDIAHAFLLSPPRIAKHFDQWEKNPELFSHFKFIFMFPQYAEATTASGVDVLCEQLKKRVCFPDISIVTSFHLTRAFIDNSVEKIDAYLESFLNKGIKIDKLILSFHGIQKRRINDKGDVYYRHAFETFFLLRSKLTRILKKDVMITFQSRFGSEEWLTPYTEPTVVKLIKAGNLNLAIYSPSFVVDCLETIDELGVELKETALEHGGDIHFIPCLNDDEKWCQDFSKFIQNQCLENEEIRKGDFYTLEKNDYLEYQQMQATELKTKSDPLTKEAKSSIMIVALTIFIDLVGFSIIFPLFPALVKYYLTFDSENYFLKILFSFIQKISNNGESLIFSEVVLFGGLLGAIYSILQFFAAPLWGAWSDRIGRRPVLIRSMGGMAIGYAFWAFSGSFTLLLISRIIDGIMGGNISTATAVVSDVTTEKNRSKGMAIIGIAFALGFVVGPALGGILSLIDLTQLFPGLVSYGINPFSVPALFALGLSLFNTYWISSKFVESLPLEKRGIQSSERSANIFKIFKPLPNPGLNIINLSYFLFLTAFSGMEFTLTFLAAERLNYTSMQNAYIFIFIGFIIAFIQGGFVRRKAGTIGEKKVSLMGLFLIIPGLILIALAYSSLMLYAGLFFLAIGSAMIMPCLTTLVTLYSPLDQQGRSVGIFRSMGALARVFGPILASLYYFKYGSSAPYFMGALFMIIPIWLLMKLKAPAQN